MCIYFMISGSAYDHVFVSSDEIFLSATRGGSLLYGVGGVHLFTSLARVQAVRGVGYETASGYREGKESQA